MADLWQAVWQLAFDPFTFDFMWEALWVGCFGALCCGVISCFVVSKGWSLVGDAVSHAVLPGIILAWLAAIPMLIGAMISGILCVMLAGWVDGRSRIKSDTALGICFTGFLALGLILMSTVSSNVHFSHVLLGHLLGITPEARLQLLSAGGIALLIVVFRFIDLKLFCFDAVQARVVGLNTVVLRVLLLMCLALTTVSTLQAVGLVQAIAMLVTPGAIGTLMSRRFITGMVIGVVAAMLSVWGGLIIAFHANVAPGSCIVLMQFALFIFTLIGSPYRGYLARRWRNRARASAINEVAASAPLNQRQ
ncbi:metal ABC transporter permease [Carnimonas bestiolae]|uniref:metal ABC transporter permease n=1 Tax=Carnimonas bestiolae TaxID=3402172 RepID=UPI003EDBB9A6